ncbi:exopolysaccharide biosynthesis protein [Caulobacter segnis]|uniref:exopolysaccharide biosynthesis protein n=1 Tax=Caulobacter segnis TaxID=88688 RepID=UPI00240FE0FF|nr:exopolysaccharide biosynthesis protein [Caulobacter segnis]MDG2521340.1 exopolysaccharide biosynthesis protein [Caulobacter segnis]
MEENDRLSEVLQIICDRPEPRVSIGEIMDEFGPRAFGAALLVFSAPNLLPLPPGSSTVLGAPLVLLSPQVAFGAEHPWLPKRVSNQNLRRGDLRGAFGKLIPMLEKVEHVSRPRLEFLFGPVGDRVIGAVCTALALILIIPIPLGNLLPAAAVSAFALGLIQRDGVFALAGYLLTAISACVLVLGASVVVASLRHIADLWPWS